MIRSTAYKTLLIILATTGLAHANIRKIFDVSFEDIQGGGLLCSVGFYGQPPAPALVDKIVRSSLESAVALNQTRDILAKAFINDDAMDATHYAGELIYKADQKRIVTMDEYRGIKRVGNDTGAYYVEMNEDKTLEGIKPERRWITLKLVFPTEPTVEEAYKSAAVEAQKAAEKGLDVNVFVNVGEKAVRTSWRQMGDNMGGYVVAKYDAATRALTRRDGSPLKP
jgi:hypothetical protein